MDDKRDLRDLFRLISSGTTVVAITSRSIAKKGKEATMDETMALHAKPARPSKMVSTFHCITGNPRIVGQLLHTVRHVQSFGLHHFMNPARPVVRIVRSYSYNQNINNWSKTWVLKLHLMVSCANSIDHLWFVTLFLPLFTFSTWIDLEFICVCYSD